MHVSATPPRTLFRLRSDSTGRGALGAPCGTRISKHWWMRALRAKSFGIVAAVTSTTASPASPSASSRNLRKFVEKISSPSGREPQQHRTNQRDVIALQVELLRHALGARNRRRIEEDQVVALARRLLEPREHVFLQQPVARRVVEAVAIQVAARPVEIRVRQIDARRRARTAGRREHGRRGRVREQIQECLAGRELANARTRRPMIEEQPRVQVVREVDEELEPAFTGHFELAALGELLVLRAALLLAASAQVRALARHVEHLGNHAERLGAPRPRLLGLDRRGRRVLLHVDEARRTRRRRPPRRYRSRTRTRACPRRRRDSTRCLPCAPTRRATPGSSANGSRTSRRRAARAPPRCRTQAARPARASARSASARRRTAAAGTRSGRCTSYACAWP